MKVYTRTGDSGTTSLIDGKRVDKFDIRIQAYGTVDELTAHIAYLRDSVSDKTVKADLAGILCKLMTISANIAIEDMSKVHLPRLSEKDVDLLEEKIDSIQRELKPINKFVIPGGHPLVSLSHIARTVTRRAERKIQFLSQGKPVDMMILRYINRLSDYFYVLARKLSQDNNVEEELWNPEK